MIGQMEFQLQRQMIHSLVEDEIYKAVTKHGHGIPAGRQSFLSIVTEEIGEIAKAINKREESDKLQGEILQVIAVCEMYLGGILKDSNK